MTLRTSDRTPGDAAAAAPGCVVVALGGNAITLEGQAGTYDEMMTNCRAMAKSLWELIDGGWRVVLTHGNGPQVGNLALQQSSCSQPVPQLPLHALDAMTQGLMGHLIELAIHNEAQGNVPPVASIITHVVVDSRDRAFESPTKPIGPFYSEAESSELEERYGWVMVDDASRGMRRVVASPRPQRILEIEAIRSLVSAGVLVIATGGGGIPVVRNGQVHGVEAVIDKDRSAAVLAAELDADALILVTGVDSVMVDFGRPTARALHEITAAQLRRYAAQGHFPAGSMGPKVESALRFVEESAGTAVITSASCMSEALVPGAGVGTKVVPG